MLSGGDFVYGYSMVVFGILCAAVLFFLGAWVRTKKTGEGPHHVDTAAGDEGDD